MSRVLFIGGGYLATSAARRMQLNGHEVMLASRNDHQHVLPWTALDVGSPTAVATAVTEVRPDVVVLVHGPSDITWCERNAATASNVHIGGAQAAVRAAAGRARVVIVSTDNVFAGDGEPGTEYTALSPANVYGSLKRDAEEIVLAGGGSVLRVSLVFGHQHDDLRTNYFASTLASLRAKQVVEAPTDHWNTPVLIDDFAEALSRFGLGRSGGVIHVGGPQRISRFDWAMQIAEAFRCDPTLVRAVEKRNSRYACRPTSACLATERMNTLPEFDGFHVRDIRASLSALIEQELDLTRSVESDRRISLTSQEEPTHGI